MAKVLSYMILVLLNMIMESLNLRKKKNGTIERDKSMVTCDVSIA